MLDSHYAPAGHTQRRSPLRVGPTCSFARRIAISSCRMPDLEGAEESDREAGAAIRGATSADVRLALIAFVPERAFLCFVRAGREALAQQPAFQAWVGGQPEGELRYQLS